MKINIYSIIKPSKDEFDVLIKEGGKLDFTYKSEADEIKEKFGISKKSFKASLTKLLAENKIVLEESCIRVK